MVPAERLENMSLTLKVIKAIPFSGARMRLQDSAADCVLLCFGAHMGP
jgi:hypothetical protein